MLKNSHSTIRLEQVLRSVWEVMDRVSSFTMHAVRHAFLLRAQREQKELDQVILECTGYAKPQCLFAALTQTMTNPRHRLLQIGAGSTNFVIPPAVLARINGTTSRKDVSTVSKADKVASVASVTEIKVREEPQIWSWKVTSLEALCLFAAFLSFTCYLEVSKDTYELRLRTTFPIDADFLATMISEGVIQERGTRIGDDSSIYAIDLGKVRELGRVGRVPYWIVDRLSARVEPGLDRCVKVSLDQVQADMNEVEIALSLALVQEGVDVVALRKRVHDLEVQLRQARVNLSQAEDHKNSTETLKLLPIALRRVQDEIHDRSQAIQQVSTDRLLNFVREEAERLNMTPELFLQKVRARHSADSEA